MTTTRIRRCGEAALLLDCADLAEAVGLARRLERLRPQAVDVVPAARTVLVTARDAKALPALRLLVEQTLAGAGTPAQDPGHRTQDPGHHTQDPLPSRSICYPDTSSGSCGGVADFEDGESAGSVSAAGVGAGSVGAAGVGAGSVGAAGVGAGSVGAAGVSAGSVGAAGVSAGSVGAAGVAAGARLHTLDVVYDGPDLADVAALAGLTPEELVRRHTQVTWRAAFGGFAPGFFYLVDDRDLAGADRAHETSGALCLPTVPRLGSPRATVPAGSVGLADHFCAVYPGVSPGGWRLLGTTDAPLWDLDRERPALLAPGDLVRFRDARGDELGSGRAGAR